MESDKKRLKNLWDKADNRIPLYDGMITRDYTMSDGEKLDYRRHIAFKAMSNELGIHYKEVVALVHANIIDLSPMKMYNHWVYQGIEMAENDPDLYTLDG